MTSGVEMLDKLNMPRIDCWYLTGFKMKDSRASGRQNSPSGGSPLTQPQVGGVVTLSHVPSAEHVAQGKPWPCSHRHSVDPIAPGEHTIRCKRHTMSTLQNRFREQGASTF